MGRRLESEVRAVAGVVVVVCVVVAGGRGLRRAAWEWQQVPNGGDTRGKEHEGQDANQWQRKEARERGHQ
eukprot:3211285-Rhodomonas_salina.1